MDSHLIIIKEIIIKALFPEGLGSGMPWGSVLHPVLCDFIITWMKEHTYKNQIVFIRSSADTKLGGIVNTFSDRNRMSKHKLTLA